MIDRAVRLAQGTSSTTSMIVLVAFNLIPLVGVLFFGWNVATILVLYWVENGIIGLLNLPKILLAEGGDPAGSPAAIGRARGVQAIPPVGIAAFFLVHYGLFWFVHGIFVFSLPLFMALRAEPVDPGVFPDPGFLPVGPGFDDIVGGQRIGPDLSGVALAAIGLAISHVVSFFINFVGRHEYRKISPGQQAQAPYGRLFILHVTIIIGAIVSLSIGSPVGAILVLVVLKTLVDLRFHVEEHRKLAARPVAA